MAQRLMNDRFTRCILPLAAGTSIALAFAAVAALPPVVAPLGNPITESKRVLGKVLFWDEQMSVNNAVSCGTCHISNRSGTDPRVARNPGPDGVLSPVGLLTIGDDKLASPGVPHSNSDLRFVRDAAFGTNVQITGRAANSNIDAAFAPNLFWDGRATSQFIDPETGAVALNANGALESQAVGPPTSSVEMSHDGVDWGQVTAKLADARPLDLATNIPADVQASLAGNPDYPELFRRAFGDTNITARRIAFAIATYQRTLVADQTPWDAFVAGNNAALTPGQQAGLNALTASNCTVCHVAPLFTGNGFRNIGVRPPAEDNGREAITGVPGDRGRFKVPSLRNVGLKTTFMHNGQFSNLTDVIRFYARAPGAAPQFPENRDPVMNTVNVPPQVAPALQDFLQNGLTDPRVANQTFPFDRPTLTSEQAARRTTLLGTGVAGSGGIAPRIIADMPPVVSFGNFRVGVDRALGGANARLGMSLTAPVGGIITPTSFLGEVTALGAGNGNGLETLFVKFSSNHYSGGQVLFLQWIVTDPAAPGGFSRSEVARVPLFCPNSGCATPCSADFNDDGTLNFFDYLDFVNEFSTDGIAADFNHDGVIDFFDYLDFVDSFSIGC